MWSNIIQMNRRIPFGYSPVFHKRKIGDSINTMMSYDIRISKHLDTINKYMQMQTYYKVYIIF